MPTVSSVLADLKSKAAENIRATYLRHGAPADQTLGVKTADMKTIAKSIRKQQALACELYETRIFEAMYLAGMVADGSLLTRGQLESFAEKAAGRPMIFESTVPWLTVENRYARELAHEWVRSEKEHVAAAGWCTWSGLVKITPDEELDLAEIRKLLESIPKRIENSPNRARAAMNSFVIAVGTYVAPLLKQAIAVAEKLGDVNVDVGDTDCEIPNARERIAKAQADGRAGVKRKTIRC
jgi:3-methyladenine DNA glycosylase AlkD